MLRLSAFPKFVMKGYKPEDIDQYFCVSCREKSIDHEVVHEPGPRTGATHPLGQGIPTVMRRCTHCGTIDGPWIIQNPKKT